MNQKNYSGSIALTKLVCAVILTAKGTKCLVIPIEENHFTEKDGAVYMSVQVIVKDETDQYGQNGFIAQKLDSKKYKELGEKAKELGEKAKEIKLPILGNIKDFSGGASDSAGSTIVKGFTNPAEDNLPF